MKQTVWAKFRNSLSVLAERRSFLGLPDLMLIVLGISVGLRAAASLLMGNEVVALPGIADQISYHTLAQRVLSGHGFSFGEAWWPATRANEPTAHWSFLYTGFLTFVYGLVGIRPLVARLIQAVVVGALHPLLVFWLADRVAGRSAAWIAAALTAVYAYFVYYAAALMTEGFYSVSILAMMYFAVRIVNDPDAPKGERRKTWLLGIGLGVSIAVTVLLRQVGMVFAPIVFAWMIWAGRYRLGFAKLVGQLALATMIVVAAVLPITLYNRARFDTFVLLNTNAGFAFYLSNHPIYGTDFQPILSEEVATYRELIPDELIGLSEAELDRELLGRGLAFVQQDPARYLRLSLSRIPDYFMFWPSQQSSALSNVARVGSFGWLWPFMIVGMAISLWPMAWGEDEYRITWLLMAAIAAYSAVHILSWSLVRYRVPLDGLMLPFGAGGIYWLWTAGRRSWQQRRIRLGVAEK